MSTRYGMADGRCMTIATSSRLLNERLMNTNGLGVFENFNYRQLLQRSGDQLITTAVSVQDTGCNMPLFGGPAQALPADLEGYSKQD